MWWSGRPHHATSILQCRLESQHQSVPGCAEECGDPLLQSGGRWPTLGVAAGLGAGPQVQRDPGFRRSATTLYPSLTGPPPPRPEPARLLRLVIRRENHQHDLPLALVEEELSQFRIRIEAVIEADGGYIE